MNKALMIMIAGLLMITNSSYAREHMDDDMHERMMKERGMSYDDMMERRRMMGGPGMMNRGGMGNMMGPGMMGNNMMGGGMHNMMVRMLDLDKQQEKKVRKIMRDQRATHCKTMTSMMDVQDELAAAYDKDERDAKAIGKVYEKLFAQKRKMIEQMVESQNKIRAVLNKEQKERFDRMHRRGMMGGPGMMGDDMMGGPGTMNGMGMMH